MRNVLLPLVISGALAGCGTLTGSANSSAGSFGSGGSSASAGSSGSGSFGTPRNEPQQVVDKRTVAADGRRLIAVLKDARLERTRDGAIIRATGVADRQGYYDAVLFSPTRMQPDETGTLLLEFRAREPQFPTPVSTEWSRTITVGAFVSNPRLAKIRRIVVAGRSGQVALTRR